MSNCSGKLCVLCETNQSVGVCVCLCFLDKVERVRVIKRERGYRDTVEDTLRYRQKMFHSQLKNTKLIQNTFLKLLEMLD